MSRRTAAAIRCAMALFALCIAERVCTAADAEPNAEQLAFFETKIRPVLAEMCYQCHSTQAGKSKGGLLLDSRSEILKGGTTGPAIVAGDPQKSLLIKAIRGDDQDLWMPPKGKKLTKEQIADFEAWIKMGAPAPKVQTLTRIQSLLEQAKTHWAYQAVKRPPVPTIKDASAAPTELDAFIESKLESQGMKIEQSADKRTLIRRASFDLLGLPPTNEEVAAFAADSSPDAYAKLVDRLLASPRYGERWGRHWLDIARYADTIGAIFGGDDNYQYAYSYRDYVIHAFNDDMPYDRFILEQIAADSLVTDDDNSALAAMGLLTVGRRKDRSVDDEVYDDRIDVLSRGLLGMTVACARCHDHKLEAIPTKDYYGIYSMLRSSKEPDVYPELRPKPLTPEYCAFVQERAKFRRSIVETVAWEAEKVAGECQKRVGDYLLAAHDAKNQKPSPQNKVMDEILKPRKLNDGLYSLYIDRQTKWMADAAPVLSFWNDLSKLNDADLAAQFSEVVARHAADTKTHPKLAKLLKDSPPKDIKEVADIYNRLFTGVFDATRKAGVGLRAARFPQSEDLSRSVRDLENTVNKRVMAALTGTKLDDGELESLRTVLSDKESPTLTKPEMFRDSHLFSEDSTKEIDKISKFYTELESKHPGSPPRAMAMRDGDMYDGKVFLRGNPNTLGDPAPRKFLQVLSPPDNQPFPKGKSGRFEFAKAVASKQNPLTARVFVNRVWGWHFGEGLVRTPSDFGFRGEKPTHPELLDYLADSFMAEGWSLKKLHRTIMLSATYRQISAVPPEVVKADPENRLWSRMNTRKLEFEAFRDAQLTVSGRLNLKEGGRPVDLGKADTASLRRTVFGLVDRKLLPNLYRSFDFPDPNFSAARRSRSALTPQALLLLNSGFEVDNSRSLAEKSKPAKGEADAEGIKRLYRLALQREPSEKEVQRAELFLNTYPKADIVRPEATDWQYGRGNFDLANKTVTSFTPLAYYTGTAWQMAQKAPDKLAITAGGGETGNGIGVGAIRRWTAPLDGRVKIGGELEHVQADSKGVVARIVYKSSNLLGEWKALHSSITTSLDTFEVKKGDVLDFVVSGGMETVADKFQWAPTITMVSAEMPGMPGMPRIWDAKTDFMDVRRMPKPIGPWEELAQVLLLSNEFMFVD